MAVLIDGKKISAQVKDECKERVAKENMDVTLAVIQVGNDPASTVYVGNKRRPANMWEFIPFLMNCRKKQQKKNYWHLLKNSMQMIP